MQGSNVFGFIHIDYFDFNSFSLKILLDLATFEAVLRLLVGFRSAFFFEVIVWFILESK